MSEVRGRYNLPQGHNKEEMKKQDKEFLTFQHEFKKWQKIFGLTGYQVYFHHEPREGCFSAITIDQSQMLAIVTLNSDVPPEHWRHRNIKEIAKHEALHLLAGRLQEAALNRYSTEEQILEAAEELVVRLEGLVP